MHDELKNVFNSKISRRDLLIFTSGLTAGVLLGKELPNLAKKRSKVAVVGIKKYSTGIKDLLKPYLSQFDLNLKGKRVLLKLNLVDCNEKYNHIVTNPDVVLAAIELFGDLGAEVVVAEGSGLRRDTNTLLSFWKYKEILKKYNTPFIDLNMDEVLKVKIPSNFTGLNEFFIPKSVMDAEFVVSMPKLKCHHWAGVTISLKNMFGIMPGIKYGWPKNKLHYAGIEKSILDISYTVRPHFTIIDGIYGIEGNGPLFGTPKNLGAVIMSDDLVAADAVGARLMGINPEKVLYLKYASVQYNEKIPVLGNLNNINVIGESIDKLKQNFTLLDEFKYLR